MVKFATERGRKECYYLHRDNQAFDEIQELKPPRNPNANVLIYGSSNGVFCCSGNSRIKTIYGESLTLWNPSLRKTLILPKSKDPQLSKHHQRCSVGFGFLPSSDNFKIVRIICTKNSDRIFTVPPEVEIYEFFTGSWRNVDVELSYVLERDNDQALLNGIVYWTACDLHRVSGTSAYGGLTVSFDLASEKFGTLMLNSSVKHLLMLIAFFYFRTQMKAMENLKIVRDFVPLYLRENGEFLGGKLFDAELDKWNLGVRNDAEYFCEAFAYVDSLFLL